MCGIVGYVGKNKCVDVLLNGLRRLEYRGYDSAGIAVVRQGQIKTVKISGKVKDLAKRIDAEWSEDFKAGAHVGIAHTRWATHGPPTEVNAHPHLDKSGRIALVHNGIIENYAEIKRHLAGKGHRFLSETDTEVLAHLVGEFYNGDLVQAVCGALKKVEGAFGIAVVAADQPDHILVARRGSPIVIGIGDNETIVASDAAAIASHTSNVIYLDDHDVALISPSGVDIRTTDNVPVSRQVACIDWDTTQAEKGGYEHFMLREIMGQPDALRNAIRGRLDKRQDTALLSGLAMDARDMADIHRVIMVACGTSLHAAMVGRYFFEDLADLHTDVEQAAEFRYRNPIISARDLVLAISQSGETADTLAAVREARQKGAIVAGICNVVGSTIARETGRGVYLHAGPEIGVASTKAFTCQVAVLLMIALKLARGRRLARPEGAGICAAIEQIPSLVETALRQNDRIAALAKEMAGIHSCFFIGRGILYPVALEGALKLKEISYIHAEGYHAAELKHGPIALLQEDVPVIALANDIPGKDKILSNMQECKARHAPVIAVVDEGDTCADDIATHTLRVPRSSPLVAPITTAVILQLLAYHVARVRGCEIDQPRNLAKSVTVE